MTITQFEKMALEAIQRSKIKGFNNLLCSFQKWKDSETNCCVYIYTDSDKGNGSGTSLNAIAAINQAIEEILIFQNSGKERVFTNE